eukprot:11290908-Alexandrium_andersonii.AAC.1
MPMPKPGAPMAISEVAQSNVPQATLQEGYEEVGMQPQQRSAQERQVDDAAQALASASAAADATQQAAEAILLQGQPVLDTSAS